MVGANPIILVGTKMDLLPAGANPKEVRTYAPSENFSARLKLG
jgi:hypothetical protein